jgi:hypothetical protein
MIGWLIARPVVRLLSRGRTFWFSLRSDLCRSVCSRGSSFVSLNTNPHAWFYYN